MMDIMEKSSDTGARLRAAKSKRSKVLKRLEIGTPVTVYSTSGQWRKVSVDGKTGYVLKEICLY